MELFKSFDESLHPRGEGGEFVITAFNYIASGYQKLRSPEEQKKKRKELNFAVPNSITQKGTPLPATASGNEYNTIQKNVNINDEIGKSLFEESLHPRGKALYLNTKKLQNLINQQRTNLADVEYLDLESIEDLLKRNSGVKDLFLTSEMNVEIRKSRFINRLNYEFCKLVEREKLRDAYLDKLGRGYIAYLKKYYPELV